MEAAVVVELVLIFFYIGVNVRTQLCDELPSLYIINPTSLANNNAT